MKNKKRKPAPVPTGHDYRGKLRQGTPPKGDCRTPDGVSGYWEENKT